VATCRFSRRAEADLVEIAHYTLEQWGENQTIRYIDDMEVFCRRLADGPELGRPCDEVRPGLRRMERGRHVIFTASSQAAFWCRAFCTSGCFPIIIRSGMTRCGVTRVMTGAMKMSALLYRK